MKDSLGTNFNELSLQFQKGKALEREPCMQHDTPPTQNKYWLLSTLDQDPSQQEKHQSDRGQHLASSSASVDWSQHLASPSAITRTDPQGEGETPV